MANLKISELPAATALAGTESFPVVQATATKRRTVTEMLDDRKALTAVEDGNGKITSMLYSGKTVPLVITKLVAATSSNISIPISTTTPLTYTLGGLVTDPYSLYDYANARFLYPGFTDGVTYKARFSVVAAFATNTTGTYRMVSIESEVSTGTFVLTTESFVLAPNPAAAGGKTKVIAEIPLASMPTTIESFRVSVKHDATVAINCLVNISIEFLPV